MLGLCFFDKKMNKNGCPLRVVCGFYGVMVSIRELGRPVKKLNLGTNAKRENNHSMPMNQTSIKQVPWLST